jgi:hypothetical protein
VQSYSKRHMVPRGLEPRTLRLLAVRSNQLGYETTATFSNQRVHLRDVPHPCIQTQARVVIDLYISSGGFTIGSPTMFPSINVLVTLLSWGGGGWRHASINKSSSAAHTAYL